MRFRLRCRRFGVRPVIVDGVFAVVLVTLVFQGALLEPVFARLYGETRPT